VLGLLRHGDADERAGEALAGLFERSAVDLHGVADAWLDLVRPVWYEHPRDRRRTGPLRLRHLRAALTGNHQLSTAQLAQLVAQAQPVQSIDERVVATIVGVVSDHNSAIR
jgi:hypothetical protein